MALRPLSHFLLRAPLLPIDAIGRRPRAIFEEPLAACALALASPELVARGKGAKAERALASYARRAAFRPTPHGLWAGVATGSLGTRTRIDTGRPRARLTLSWARLAALGRALLDDPEERERARLRTAPSLLVSGDRAMWLAFGAETQGEARAAEIDPALAQVIDCARAWRSFGELRAVLAEVEEGDPDELDDYLLALVDDGLLAHDLEPPLIGPPPLDWMRARLGGRLPALDPIAEELAALASGLATLTAEQARRVLAELEEKVARLPGHASPQLHAVLVHEPRNEPTLSKAAVSRAAELAPLLFRLQEALVPPACERDLQAGIFEALSSVTEIFGAGALDLAPLALGDYGAVLDRELEPDRPPVPAALLAYLIDRLLASQGGVLRLSSSELDAILPEASIPETFELVFAPAREPRGASAGTGWLLGLHAPAGATFGRFAHAEPALRDALLELAEAERAARPGETRLDLAYAPARSLGDLAAHPPIRAQALALSSWPADESLAPAAIEVCADEAAPVPLALRADARPIVPSPLERMRGSTAPPGVYRLLAGFSFYRQHAPWALQLGPLADLERWPRITLDGFVVAPASWRIPEELDGIKGVRRWRREQAVPRHIQIGREDELLLVDLEDPEQAAFLTKLDPAARPRAWEVWPPLDQTVDRAGRRVEVVVAVVDAPDEPEQARFETASVAQAGRVPLPRMQAHDPERARWRTLKLFGAPDRADRLLLAVSEPIRAARAAGAIDRWFFLRYIDGPGRREHLRLRWRGGSVEQADALVSSLHELLEEARAAGDLVSLESADYHRELARYGAESIDVIERLFETDSELACALLGGEEPESDLIELLVRGFDALVSGLGLDPTQRLALAKRRRAAHALELDALGDVPLATEHRARQARLYQALTAPSALFARHLTRVVKESSTLDAPRRDALLPALLHLAAVRLIGPDRLEEARAYYLWERALDGVVTRAKGG